MSSGLTRLRGFLNSAWVRVGTARAKGGSRDPITLAATLGAAAIVVGSAWAAYWFTEQEPNLDDLGLFNPVHTYLQNGDMSYPIYGMFEATIVHPPTHYLILAWAMRISGLPVEGAALLPLLVLMPMIALLIIFSKFSVSAKFALLAGAVAGLVIWAPPSFIRPDLHQATAWFAGLIALETGRLANWDWRRLGAGATLIALSGALHYPASASLAAVAVYAVWAWRSLGFRAARHALGALAVGSALILVPYVGLYLLPHWGEVSAFARLANERGGSDWLAGFDQARQQYRYFGATDAAGRGLDLVATPVLELGVPVVFVTTAMLAVRRETRGIAFASAPYLLFLLFYARGKSLYYYTPEFTLYFASVGYAALLVISAVLERLRIGIRRRVHAIAIMGLALTATVAVFEPATLRGGGYRSWKPLHEDMEIARAAGSQLLPPNALVGTNDLGLWYSTGASRIHYLALDVNQIRDTSQVNLLAYFGEFDAIAEARYDTWATFNNQREAIPEWYADGLLHVRGFYFGDRRGKPLTWMAYHLLSTRKTPIAGFAFQGKDVHYFRPAVQGTHIYSASICPADSIPATQYLVPWQLLTPLPGTTHPPAPSTKTIVSYVTARGLYRELLKPLLGRSCKIREEVALAVEKENASDFLRRWRAQGNHDEVQVLPRVAAEPALYSPPRATAPLRPNIELRQVKAPAELVVRKARGLLRLATPPQQYAQVVAVPLPRSNRQPRWLKVRARVVKGRVGICILILASGQGCLQRRAVSEGRHFGPIYLPVPPTRDRVAFYVDNDRHGRSEFELRSLELVTLTKGLGSARSERRPGR